MKLSVETKTVDWCHYNPVYAAFNPAGNLLVCVYNEGSIIWLDAKRGGLLSRRQTAYRFTSVAFHPDGTRLVKGTVDGRLIWWDPEERTPTVAVTTEEPFEYGGALDLAFSRDGSLLACAGSLLDGSLVLYEGKSGEEVGRLRGHRDYVTAVAFSPDGKLLASGTQYDDGLIRLWNVENQEVVRRFNPHKSGYTSVIFSLAFSPDGKLLYGNDWEAVKVWSLSSGALLHEYDGSGSEAPFALHPEGDVIAFEGQKNNAVQLVDVSTKAVLATIGDHCEHISTLVFNSQGTVLVSGDREGNVFQTEITPFDS